MGSNWIKTVQENYINLDKCDYIHIEFDGRKWIIKAWIGSTTYNIGDNFGTAVEASAEMDHIIIRFGCK